MNYNDKYKLKRARKKINKGDKMKKTFIVIIIGLFVLCTADQAIAVSKASIDTGVDKSIAMLKDIAGGKEVLAKSKGVLVFPAVFKAGIGIGGEYGEGALLIDDKIVDYYNTAAASIGFQLGVQKKTEILVFMDETALKNFQNASGWEIGADASVAVIAVGAGGSIDTTQTNKPIVAFVFDQKGLMYNLSLEGAKISKIVKKA